MAAVEVVVATTTMLLEVTNAIGREWLVAALFIAAAAEEGAVNEMLNVCTCF